MGMGQNLGSQCFFLGMNIAKAQIKALALLGGVVLGAAPGQPGESVEGPRIYIYTQIYTYYEIPYISIYNDLDIFDICIYNYIYKQNSEYSNILYLASYI